MAACWCAAAVAVVCVSPLSNWFVAPDLLIGPVDREGFRALALAAAVVLCGAAVYVTASAASRPPAPTWARVVSGVASLAATAFVLLLAYPVLLVGALAFSTEYRTIGSVDGHELIAEVGAGPGQFPISAGIRHGWLVDFSHTTGDTSIVSGPTLKSIRFHIADGPHSVTITYRPGLRPERHEGVLVVQKPE